MELWEPDLLILLRWTAPFLAVVISPHFRVYGVSEPPTYPRWSSVSIKHFIEFDAHDSLMLSTCFLISVVSFRSSLMCSKKSWTVFSVPPPSFLEGKVASLGPATSNSSTSSSTATRLVVLFGLLDQFGVPRLQLYFAGVGLMASSASFAGVATLSLASAALKRSLCTR